MTDHESKNDNSPPNDTLHIDFHHNQDKVFKESLELFKGASLGFLGIETTGIIEEILSGEITQTTTKKAYADKVFRVSKNKGIHAEWEADINNNDIMRFASYNIDLSRKHGIPFETLIITNKTPLVSSYKNPSVSFTPKVVNLKDRNADKTIKGIKDKLSRGESVNLLEVIYLPLYGSESGMTTAELMDMAIKLTPVAAQDDKTIKEKLQSLIILLNSSFVSDDELKRILEVNRMILEGNRAVRVLQGMGGEEKATEIALEMLADGFSAEQISKYVKMPEDWVRSLQSTPSTPVARR